MIENSEWLRQEMKNALVLCRSVSDTVQSLDYSERADLFEACADEIDSLRSQLDAYAHEVAGLRARALQRSEADAELRSQLDAERAARERLRDMFETVTSEWYLSEDRNMYSYNKAQRLLDDPSKP